MKILGIGLSRTGTTSLARALSILGYSVCDFPPILEYENGKIELSHLDYIEKFDALTDTPVSRFYKELDKKYPNSKFILTVRDIDDWLESCKHHMIKNRVLTASHHQLYLDLYGDAIYNESKYREGYKRHIEDVKEYFKDRQSDILILNICKDANWEPLCEFLGKPIPNNKFPKLNATPERLELGPKLDESVYLVVPSMGYMRCETAGFVLRMKLLHGGIVNTDWITGKPSEDARCKAITKFLNNPKLGEWFFFVDADVCPPDNIFNLVHIANEKGIKIISGLYHSFQWNMPTPLTFDKCDDEDAYRVNRKLVPNTLTKVDATGAGCLFIHREVLEKFKENNIPPFHRVYYDDGTVWRGEDVYFCNEASKLGYDTYVHTGYMCSHYKGVDLKRIQDLLAAQQRGLI